MSVNEELQEHTHHASEPFDKMVAATMAFIAAVLAIVTVLGHQFSTEAMLNQEAATDQWAFYQGKDTRRYVAQTTADSLVALKGDPALAQRYASDAVKYRVQGDAIQEKARELERERTTNDHRAQRFDYGEVFLEIAIVLSSLAILTKRRPFFVTGVASAAIGAAIAGTAYWIHS